MRYLAKPEATPGCITDFLAKQMTARAEDAAAMPESAGTVWQTYRVDYGAFRSGPFLAELTWQQRGLCGYTGVALDDRLAERQPDKPRRYWYMPHIEHLKPQSVCRRELEHAGAVYGRDVCEDMDHRNMIAAVEVGGSPAE